MFTQLFDRASEVVLAQFTGVVTTEDFVNYDAAHIHFLSNDGQLFADRVRGLCDYSAVEAIAAKQNRRAGQPPTDHQATESRVAPRNTGDGFGHSYRRHQRIAADSEHVVVPTMAEAYALLGLDSPHFEPVEQS